MFLRSVMAVGWVALLPGLEPPGRGRLDGRQTDEAQMIRLWARLQRSLAPVPAADLDMPLMDVLSWLRRRDLLFRGSPNDQSWLCPAPQIDTFMRPVTAVFATDEPYYATFFALVDRSTVRSQRVQCLPGLFGRQPRLYFSVDADVDYWRSGVLAVLAREPFSRLVGTSEWHSRVKVRPLARIAVTPDDFPWRDKVLHHTSGQSMSHTYRAALQQAWRRRHSATT